MYTDSMVSELRAAAPLNYNKAQELASNWGVSARSVVSKAISLGVEYEKAGPKGASRVRKADLVRKIASRLNTDYDALSDLERASASTLQALLLNLPKQADAA